MHAPCPVRVTRIMQKTFVEVFLCRPRATWDKVGLYLLREMEMRFTHGKECC